MPALHQKAERSGGLTLGLNKYYLPEHLSGAYHGEERAEDEETAIGQIRRRGKNDGTKCWNDFSPIVVPDIAGARRGIRNSSRGVSSAFIESLIDFLSLSVRRTVSAARTQAVRQKPPRHGRGIEAETTGIPRV